MPPLSQPYLALARIEANLDPTRPQQAVLRRATSTAYYAMFHFVVEQSLAFLLGGTPPREPLRVVLSRAYAHSEIAAGARTFSGGNLPALLAERMGGIEVPADLRTFCTTFLILQERRHSAEYDIGHRLTRPDVNAEIDRVEEAFDLWPGVRDTPAGELFLVAALIWNRIRER